MNVIALGTISPMKEQIYDNFCAKKQWLNLAPTLAQQLLLVDEIMRAGKGMGRGGPMEEWFYVMVLNCKLNTNKFLNLIILYSIYLKLSIEYKV